MKIKTNIKAGQCPCASDTGPIDHPDAPAYGEVNNPGPLGWVHLPWLK